MLNLRQALFVQRYLVSLCAKTAYIEAYGTKNPRTAEVNGHRLLRNAEVKEAVLRAQAELLSRNGIEQDWIIARLRSIADGHLGMFLNTELGCIDLEKIKPSNSNCIEFLRFGKFGLHIKIRDPVRALELLGKYLGLWSEKHQTNQFKNETKEHFGKQLESVFTAWKNAQNIYKNKE